MRTQTAVLGASLVGASALAFFYFRNRASGESGDALDEIIVSGKRLGDEKLYSDSTQNPLEKIAAAARAVASKVSNTTEGSTSGVRGLRNNNPGNIRLSSEKWQGLAAEQTDPAFFRFSEPRWGVRAMAKILLNYEKRYSLNTVRGIINRWAPPIENNTNAYVDAVARAIEVKPDEPLSVSAYLPGLTAAIIRHENGQNPYSTMQIKEWVYLP